MPGARLLARVPNFLRGTLVPRLDAGDRALFLRCALLETTPRVARLFWTVLTHLGGSTASIAAATLPLFMGKALHDAAVHATATLVLSHLVVQLIKRTVGRPRPSCRTASTALAAEPDRFSFPSGHSAAAMSVALAYALAFPALATPLLIVAGLVGMSRVFLGVHYPGDVLMGQLIAALVGLGLR